MNAVADSWLGSTGLSFIRMCHDHGIQAWWEALCESASHGKCNRLSHDGDLSFDTPPRVSDIGWYGIFYFLKFKRGGDIIQWFKAEYPKDLAQQLLQALQQTIEIPNTAASQSVKESVLGYIQATLADLDHRMDKPQRITLVRSLYTTLHSSTLHEMGAPGPLVNVHRVRVEIGGCPSSGAQQS